MSRALNLRIDGREILCAELARRQARNLAYSMRAFARDLGISTSAMSDALTAWLSDVHWGVDYGDMLNPSDKVMHWPLWNWLILFLPHDAGVVENDENELKVTLPLSEPVASLLPGLKVELIPCDAASRSCQ